MTGFLVFDFADRYAQAAQEMAGWVQEGRLKSFEDVATGGVDKFPETLLRLFSGDNVGQARARGLAGRRGAVAATLQTSATTRGVAG